MGMNRRDGKRTERDGTERDDRQMEWKETRCSERDEIETRQRRDRDDIEMIWKQMNNELTKDERNDKDINRKIKDLDKYKVKMKQQPKLL